MKIQNQLIEIKESIDKLQQTLNRTSDQDLCRLSVLQIRLLKVIFKSANTKRSRFSQRLSMEYVAEKAGTTPKSAKNGIWRLKQKRILRNAYSKDGRGGWVIYEIPSEVFSWLQKHENRNLEFEHLPIEWQKVDISGLECIGFRKKHLIDLYRSKKISSVSVQESIYNFAWGLKYKPEDYFDYKDPLYILMNFLRRGWHWIEAEYKSELDEIIEKMTVLNLKKSQQWQKNKAESIDFERRFN